MLLISVLSSVPVDSPVDIAKIIKIDFFLLGESLCVYNHEFDDQIEDFTRMRRSLKRRKNRKASLRRVQSGKGFMRFGRAGAKFVQPGRTVERFQKYSASSMKASMRVVCAGIVIVLGAQAAHQNGIVN